MDFILLCLDFKTLLGYPPFGSPLDPLLIPYWGPNDS
jgi:hypothetical protein